jgi:hypothetical protein
VPLTAQSDQAHFIIEFSSEIDLSAATVTYRAFVQAASGGVIQGYVQEGPDSDPARNYAQLWTGWLDLSGISGWQDIVFDVGAASTTFDKTGVARIGIEIAGGNSSAWTDPTVVYVDSIAISGSNPAVGPFTFDGASSISTSTTGAAANVLWLNGYDPYVAGSQVTWLGP